jgi:hypothetical protein
MLKRTNHSASGLLRKLMEMGYTTMGWHGVTARFDDRVEYGELGAPPLSERSFSAEKLANPAKLRSDRITRLDGFLLCAKLDIS